MPHFEFEIIAADHLKLYGQGWEPAGVTRAVVCLVHGLGEHGGRYDHMAEVFNQNQYALLSFDLRGHGKSEGKRGHAPGYAALMSDIAKLLNEAAVRYPDLPRFLYGHSLGGNLAIHYVLKQRPSLVGVIASAPLLRLAYKPSVWKSGILRGMQAMQLNFSMPSGLDDNALSCDQNVVHTYRNDPLTHDLISARLAMDMLRYGQWNLNHAEDFSLPLLLMHGDADRITSAAASAEFARKAARSCTLKLWKGFNHELHNEPEQQQVFDCVLEWMKQMTRDTATG